MFTDDIDIDEPGPSSSASSHEIDKKNKGIRNAVWVGYVYNLYNSWNKRDFYYLADTKTERQKLFDDDAEIKPRVRMREEIIATYRKTEVIYAFGSFSSSPL